MNAEYILTALCILCFIWLVVDIFILFPKRAMHWWNNLSHYGKSVLMSRIGINHIDDLKKSDIYEIYRDHIRRQRSNR